MFLVHIQSQASFLSGRSVSFEKWDGFEIASLFPRKQCSGDRFFPSKSTGKWEVWLGEFGREYSAGNEVGNQLKMMPTILSWMFRAFCRGIMEVEFKTKSYMIQKVNREKRRTENVSHISTKTGERIKKILDNSRWRSNNWSVKLSNMAHMVRNIWRAGLENEQNAMTSNQKDFGNTSEENMATIIHAQNCKW